jgi:hypothetical protein
MADGNKKLDNDDWFVTHLSLCTFHQIIIKASPNNFALYQYLSYLFYIKRENLLLKIELDLRSQFFFIAYLQCIRSSINPRHGGELAKIPSIIGI